MGRALPGTDLRGEGEVVPGKEIRGLLPKEGQTGQTDKCTQRPKRRLCPSLLSSRLMAERALHPQLVGILKPREEAWLRIKNQEVTQGTRWRGDRRAMAGQGQGSQVLVMGRVAWDAFWEWSVAGQQCRALEWRERQEPRSLAQQALIPTLWHGP